MGVVNSRQWGNNRPDGESLKAAGTSYSPFVYTSTTASTAVTGTVPLVQGEGVCADGSFTGQNCSGQITTTNTCVNESDDSGVLTHVCSLAIADPANQTKLVGPGDSGGPVYVGSSLQAEGVVSGGSSTGVELPFARIDTLQSTFGGTVEHT